MAETNYQALINQLEDQNRQIRQRARLELINAGESALPLLAKTTLTKANSNLRWQAAKTLSQMKAPAVIPVLIAILRDNEYFDIRWLAAEGLIKMGKKSLVPLFRSLKENADSVWLREGAHHVLRSLHHDGIESGVIEKTLHALEHIDPAIQVPWAAEEALKQLQEEK
jgi:HEAT repeat protein